jgi:riboflavin synthase
MVTFHIAASTIAGKVKPNDSIAVDGVCLTVTDIDAQRLKFDLVPETLKKTTLGFKSEGDFVNLQRSLGIQDRIDGHFVQGHVDTVAKIATIKDFGENREMVFEIPPEFNSLIIPRGSIAIDGISLTIAECIGNQFKVAVIPHTLKLTTMKHYRR